MPGNLLRGYYGLPSLPLRSRDTQLKVEVEGSEAIKMALKKYASGYDYKMRRRVMRNALKPFNEKLESELPKSRNKSPYMIKKAPKGSRENPPGTLKKAARSWTRSKSKTTMFAGLRKRFTDSGIARDAFYMRFPMFGFTHIAHPKKDVRLSSGYYKKVKWIPGDNVFARVWNAEAPKTERRLIEKLKQEHDRLAKKNGLDKNRK